MPERQPSTPRRRKYRVVFLEQSLTPRAKRNLKIIGYVLLAVIILAIILIFGVFPIIFMNSIALQRLIIFTNVGLPQEQNYYNRFKFIVPGLRNFYVTVKDEDSNMNLISLGLWHLLPHNVSFLALLEREFNFDRALRHTNHSILLYFHGSGESRSYSRNKFHILRIFFHIIAFDYRNYGDSTKATLSEDRVVDDSVQVYEWLMHKTNASIFIWGHSLGSALATRTVAQLKTKGVTPTGLILEAAFTTMRDELPVHPYGRLFAWLPWFKATVLDPLQRNGFIFNTTKHILDVEAPILILHSEDDSIVPYRFGRKLHDIVNEKSRGQAIYYLFSAAHRYDHFFLYEDPDLPIIIEYFIRKCIHHVSFNTLYNSTITSSGLKKIIHYMY